MHDAIVIGVGTFGAAACESLARRGADVLGLEQFTIAHNRGSHHGRTRIFRIAYYEHPDYVPLLKRAYSQWRELEAKSGLRLLHEVGMVYIGRPEDELIRGTLDSAVRHGVEHRTLSWNQVAAEFPQFNVPDDHVGLFEARAGFVLAEPSVKALADRARDKGAMLLESQQVLGWSATPKGVTVTTSAGTHQARSLIVTAGAWTSQLVSDTGAPLVVTRQVLGWVMPPHPREFEGQHGGGGFPCWAVGDGPGRLHYGFPIMEGDRGLKLALHAPGRETKPHALDKTVTPDDEATFRSVLGRYLAKAAGPTVKTCVCMYTNSPDGHFIIDRHPQHPNVVFACGFSGHGFKFAPVLGEALADLATMGRSDLPIEFLSTKRFAR